MLISRVIYSGGWHRGTSFPMLHELPVDLQLDYRASQISEARLADQNIRQWLREGLLVKRGTLGLLDRWQDHRVGILYVYLHADADKYPYSEVLKPILTSVGHRRHDSRFYPPDYRSEQQAWDANHELHTLRRR